MNCPEIRTRLMRYIAVGLLANLAGYVLFLVFLIAGMAPVPASGITYVVMVSASYLANRKWAFRSQGSHARDLPRYLLAYGIGLLVALISMYVLSAILHPALAQIVVTGLAAVVIYASLELLRFGKQESRHAN